MPYYIPSLLDCKDVEPMTEKVTKIWLGLQLADMKSEFHPFTKEIGEQMGFPGQLLASRLPFYDCGPVSTSAAIICLCHCESAGDVVMYAFALSRLSKRLKNQPVTLKELADVFPMGFPSKAAMSATWEAQKGYAHDAGVDNLIDHPQALLDEGSEARPPQPEDFLKWLKN